jgi:hypothetical protein
MLADCPFPLVLTIGMPLSTGLIFGLGVTAVLSASAAARLILTTAVVCNGTAADCVIFTAAKIDNATA